MYDLETFELLRTMQNHTDTVLSVDSCQDIIVSGGKDFQLLVSGLQDGRRITKLCGTNSLITGNQTWVSKVCATADIVIAGMNNGEIFTWDVTDWLLRRKVVLEGASPVLSLLAWRPAHLQEPHPDASFLVKYPYHMLIGSADGRLRRYDLAGGSYDFDVHVGGGGPDGGVIASSLANVSDADGNSKGWPLIVSATPQAWYVYDSISGRMLYSEECACTHASAGFTGNTVFVCDARGHFRIVNVDTIVNYWL